MKRLLFKLAEVSALSGSSPRTLQGMRVDKRTIDLINDISRYGWDSRKVAKLHPYTKFSTVGVGGGAYIGPKFVVKDSCIVDRPSRKRKCPTVVLSDGLIVQPRCVVFADLPDEVKMKYVKSGAVQLDNYGSYYLVDGGDDAHDENFGLLDGKLVQFDW